MRNNSRPAITDADVQKIKEALDPYLLTDKNIQKLERRFEKRFEKKFATKDEVKELSDKMTQGFAWVIEEFAKVRAEMVTKADLADIMFELKAIREEITATTHRNKSYSDILANHDTRIIVLEEKIAF